MPTPKKSTAIIPIDRVQQRILILRGQRIILSLDLAKLYGVPASQLNQAVQRNKERFPDDFMFQLTQSETASLSRSQLATLNDLENLKSQFANSKKAAADVFLRSQSVILKPDMRGRHLKYRPYAFTEQGVAMLSAVLRSPTAVRVSIEIVRAFVRLRQLLASHENLRAKLQSLEQKLADHNERFVLVFDAIRELMQDPDDPPTPPVGFHTEIATPKPSATRKNRLP